jgi:hypothetical protein
MKELVTPQSGKLGNTVSFPTRYGQAQRPAVVPADPRTPAQLLVRSTLAHISAQWRQLADDQLAAWITTAGKTRSRPRLGQSGPLTGCQLFIKINWTLASLGLDLVTVPPRLPAFPRNPVGALSITNTRGVITLKLSVPSLPAQYIRVLGTAPCSRGVSVPRRFTILGPLPAPSAGVSDITDLYVEKYDAPPVGSRIFIRTLQIIDGWQDLPKQTTATVPAS